MTQERWRQVSEWPMVAAAVLFLAAYSFQVIANLTEAQSTVVDTIIWVTWLVFALDYAMCLVLARRRAQWFVRNLHELLILALPVLRPLRLLRLVTLLKLLHRTAGNAIRGRILTFVLGSAALLTYCGALAVLDAEENAAGANITNFGDAMWWAMVTITTVGYGDHYPVTVVGRCVAGGLMVCGIAVLGVVTASVASWLVEQVSSGAAAAATVAEEPMKQEIRRLAGQVERLSALLENADGELRGGLVGARGDHSPSP
ncbi:potassium channel family protein [Arthrobacter sp. 2RAF6]|uniref:potassium channel family protein n=1 Tax=Arthrobacter sp. 2RAF6 TaxID=3233002 RepID=UPI003F900E78